MMKASRGGYTDIIDALQTAGGNASAHNIEEYTASDYASRYGQEEAVQVLQEYGAEASIMENEQNATVQEADAETAADGEDLSAEAREDLPAEDQPADGDPVESMARRLTRPG